MFSCYKLHSPIQTCLSNLHKIHKHTRAPLGGNLGFSILPKDTCTLAHRPEQPRIKSLTFWPRPADICTRWPLMLSHQPQSTSCEALEFLNRLFGSPLKATIIPVAHALILPHVSLQVNCPLICFNSALSENSQSFQLRLSVVHSVCGGCW